MLVVKIQFLFTVFQIHQYPNNHVQHNQKRRFSTLHWQYRCHSN